MEAPAPLRQPAFRSLWLAGLVSEAGDWLLFIALPIVVYRQTGSALGTSFAFLALLAPAIVLAPVAGRLADRHDRRRMMLIVCGLQALSLLPLLLVGDHSGLPIVYAVIVVQSALTTLFDPAKNALLPTLVSRDQLVSANSLVALNEGVARLVGGPLGGLLLAAGDLRTIVVADALTFFADIAQGIFLVLFIVFVARRLHGGAGETGLLRGVQAVGAIGAGLVLATVARRRAPVRLMAGAALAFGAISLLVWNLPALTTAPAVYAVLFAAVGAPGVGMIAAGLLTGPLGLGAILDLQAGIYLVTGVVAVRVLQGATRRAPPLPSCVSAAPAGRPR